MWKFAVVGLVLAATIAACSGADMQPPDACETMLAPGTLVAAPGIDLQVRDQYGQAQAIGTSAVVKRSTGEVEQVSIADTLHIRSAYNVTGDFSVALSRPYYQDLTIAKVSVLPNGCIVNTTEVPVALQLAPGAPPLRALAVAGATYLYSPGAQAQLGAHFDADPGVSRAATWTVNDPTLATIDANGLLTAKCPNAGGTVKVTATSVATPHVSGDASMSVAPQTSCP
jgi:Big-like domain-containing protein